MKSLLAALFGGFAGALVTGGITLWRERGRRRRGLRVAVRLVAAELRTIELRLHIAAASGSWHELRAHPLAHAEWDEHRSAFAAQLPLERWSQLHSAYRLAAVITLTADARQDSDRLTLLEREELETGAQAAGAAVAAIDGDSPMGEEDVGHLLLRSHHIRARHP